MRTEFIAVSTLLICTVSLWDIYLRRPYRDLFLHTNLVCNLFESSSMRDRGIILDPYLDHGVLVRVCQEVGVPVEELDPSSAGAAQVSPCTDCATLPEVANFPGRGNSPVNTVGYGQP